MEKGLVLKAEVREHTGTKHAARVRKEGRIPAIVYGHGQAPISVSVNAHDFVEGLHHGHRLIDLQIGRKKQKTLLKDIQYDYLGRDVIHVDLQVVDVTETIKVRVPIELRGTAKGTHESGIIEEHADRLEVECMVSNIPETLVVVVKEVGVGDSIHAGDVELPEGVNLVSDPSMLLVTCHLVAAAKTAEQAEEEAPVAPDVIGDVKEPGEGPAAGEEESK